MVARVESQSSVKLHWQLEAIVDEIRSATELARQLASSVDEKSFSRQPAPGSWSVAECLEHLSLTTDAYLPLLDGALERSTGGEVDSAHRYRKDWIGRLLAWSMEPPSRVKTKTSDSFKPKRPSSKAAVITEFVRLQDALASRVRQSSGFQLEAIRLTSPFDSRVKYNLYSAFCLILAHQRRHLWQAQQVIIHLRD